MPLTLKYYDSLNGAIPTRVVIAGIFQDIISLSLYNLRSMRKFLLGGRYVE